MSPLPFAHSLLRVLVKETAKRSIPGSEVLSHATPLLELEPILDCLVQHSVAALVCRDLRACEDFLDGACVELLLAVLQAGPLAHSANYPLAAQT